MSLTITSGAPRLDGKKGYTRDAAGNITVRGHKIAGIVVTITIDGGAPVPTNGNGTTWSVSVPVTTGTHVLKAFPDGETKEQQQDIVVS